MPAPDHSGRRVGGFELIEPLASGGFATVYRAHQVRLDRDVAVKVLDPALARDPEIAARFEREGRAAASLDHPNVVAVYEAGEDDGLVYLAMRLVKGETLDDLLLRGGPLTVARTVKIIRPVADALDHAHEVGLIHRDVKPSNIFIEGDRIFLGDFGIAATADQVGRYTTGALGTAHYMAPEQASGGELDGRADLYALGCVVHRCLTGRPPFDKGELVATLVAHVNEPVPRTGNAGMDQFLAMALAKDPANRFSSGAEMVASLRSVGPVDLASLLAADRPANVASDAPTGESIPARASETSARVDPVPPAPPVGAAAGPAPGPPPSTIAPIRVGAADDVTVPPTPVADGKTTAPNGGVATTEDDEAPISDGSTGGSGRSRWPVLVGAGLMVAVVLGGLWFTLLREDDSSVRGGSGDPAIADPIPVGERPLVVTIADGSALVANVGDESLSQIPLDGAPARPAADIGAAPSDVDAGGGVAWVTTRAADRTAVRFDLEQGSFVTLPLRFSAVRVAAADDGSAWVSDPDGGRVVHIDRSGSVAGVVDIGGAPTDMVLAAGSLWVADAGRDTVVEVDPATEAVVDTIALEGSSGAITASDDALYVVDRGASTLTRIVMDDPTDQTTVDSADVPTRPEVGAGGVWVVSPQNGALHRHDLETLAEEQVIDVGGPLGGFAIDGDDLWVTRSEANELVKVTVVS